MPIKTRFTVIHKTKVWCDKRPCDEEQAQEVIAKYGGKVVDPKPMPVLQVDVPDMTK